MNAVLHPDWLVPDWPAPSGVRAVFTTRAGGLSTGPFESMNLGSHVNDQPDSVMANRLMLQRSTGSHGLYLNQVHGNAVLALETVASDDTVTADACVTTQRKLVCTILVADCLPVLLASEDGRVVAAAHAGWRGLAGVGEQRGIGILEALHASFVALAQAGQRPSAIHGIAWLGPCIGPSVFEVGSEVKAAFEVVQPEAGSCFVKTGPNKYLANLPALARLRLQALGITQVYGNDGSTSWCTVSNPSRFFSHRRDAGIHGNGFGTTGRMAACIWLD